MSSDKNVKLVSLMQNPQPYIRLGNVLLLLAILCCFLTLWLAQTDVSIWLISSGVILSTLLTCAAIVLKTCGTPMYLFR